MIPTRLLAILSIIIQIHSQSDKDQEYEALEKSRILLKSNEIDVVGKYNGTLNDTFSGFGFSPEQDATSASEIKIDDNEYVEGMADISSIIPKSKEKKKDISAIWTNTSSTDNRKIAIIGVTSGTAFVDVTNLNQSTYLGTLLSHDRKQANDIKIYKHYVYILQEDEEELEDTNDLQIFDLNTISGASGPVSFRRNGSSKKSKILKETGYFTHIPMKLNEEINVVEQPEKLISESIETHTSTKNMSNLTAFKRKLFINEEKGYAYITGAENNCNKIINLQSNPVEPTFIGCFFDHEQDEILRKIELQHYTLIGFFVDQMYNFFMKGWYHIGKSLVYCWIVLLVSIVIEIKATTLIKEATDASDMPLMIYAIGMYIFCLFGFALCLQQIEVSVAYAIWSALGTAVVAVYGFLVCGEECNAIKIASLVLIMIGVVGLNLQDDGH